MDGSIEWIDLFCDLCGYDRKLPVTHKYIYAVICPVPKGRDQKNAGQRTKQLLN